MRTTLQVTWIALGILVCGLARGQSAATFEVASVKPAPVTQGERLYFGPPRGGPGTFDPGQITWSYATLKAMLLLAYDVNAFQVSGPPWLDTERYHVIAKVPPGSTKAEVRLMWQDLLRERFGLVLHHEPKEFQVQELLVGKDGPKLTKTDWDPLAALPEGPPKQGKNGGPSSPGVISMVFPDGNGSAHVRMVAKSQSVSQLTTALGNALRRPVIDKTGLTELYDYNLEYKMPLPPALAAGVGLITPQGNDASDPEGDIGTAVQQLGLRLVSGKARLDVLMIDKAEKVPAEN